MTEVESPDFGDEIYSELETPELLMEATVWVLAEEGVQGLSLRKVAEKAGKNRGLVHYYFESKADLLASLLNHIRDGTDRLIGIDENDPPHDKLRTALRFHAYGPGGEDEAGRHYYLAILQLQALASHDPAVRDQFTRNQKYVIDRITEIIEEGIEEGIFNPVEPRATAQFLVTTIEGARTAELTTELDSPREIAFEFLETIISESLVKARGG